MAPTLTPSRDDRKQAQAQRRGSRQLLDELRQDLQAIQSLDEEDLEKLRMYMAQGVIADARVNFESFILLFRPPGSEYVYSKLHQFLAETVQGVADATIKKRQCVSVPPQHGKSSLLSVLAPAWIMGRFPGIQLAITGFSVDLVTDFSKEVRGLVEHPFYKMVFPRGHILRGSNKAENWRMSNGSSMRAKSVGQKLTGRRVDWLIIDDAHSGRAEAESPTYRNRVKHWYYADCMSRLSPNAAVFIIGTRWHSEDLIGHLTSKDKVEQLILDDNEEQVFEVTNIPALCEDPDIDPLGRKEGEAAFPEVRDEKFLRSMRSAYISSGTDYEWSSQFQGNPKASSSGEIPVDKIRRIKLEGVPKHINKVESWDLATGEAQVKDGDYHVRVVTAYDWETDSFYIIDMTRTRRKWGIVRQLFINYVKEAQKTFNLQKLAIEAVAGFGAVFSDIKVQLEGLLQVVPRHPPKGNDKLQRARPWITKMDAHRVYMVIADWNVDMITEMEGFPAGDHDDIVDAVSNGWETHTGRRRNGAMPETSAAMADYVKRKLAAEKAAEEEAERQTTLDTERDAWFPKKSRPQSRPAVPLPTVQVPPVVSRPVGMPSQRPRSGTVRFR